MPIFFPSEMSWPISRQPPSTGSWMPNGTVLTESMKRTLVWLLSRSKALCRASESSLRGDRVSRSSEGLRQAACSLSVICIGSLQPDSLRAPLERQHVVGSVRTLWVEQAIGSLNFRDKLAGSNYDWKVTPAGGNNVSFTP